MGKVSIISAIVGVTLVGLVLGLSSYNEQAEAGLSVGSSCESFGGVQQHWDKIIFEVNQNLFNNIGPKTLFPPVIFPTLTWDIKVQQDPLSATNLERTVADFLNANNYKTFDDKEVRPHFISIVDVEYEIDCFTIVNLAPTANAGPDQNMVFGDSLVTLDGSASFDPEGALLTFSWTQIGGTATVKLSDPTAVKPTFTAPFFGDTLAFLLIVSDGTTISSDTVTITVFTVSE